MLMIMMMVQRKGFLFGKISFLMRIVAVIGNILFSTRVKVLVKKFAKNWKKIRGPNLDIRCCCCLICLFVCWDQKNFSRKDGFFFVFFWMRLFSQRLTMKKNNDNDDDDGWWWLILLMMMMMMMRIRKEKRTKNARNIHSIPLPQSKYHHKLL